MQLKNTRLHQYIVSLSVIELIFFKQNFKFEFYSWIKNTIKRKNSIKSGQPTKMDPQKVTQVRGIFFLILKLFKYITSKK